MSHDMAWLVISPSEAPTWQERDLEPSCSRCWGTNVENGPRKLSEEEEGKGQGKKKKSIQAD